MKNSQRPSRSSQSHLADKAQRTPGDAQHIRREAQPAASPVRGLAAWALRLAAGIALFGRGKKRAEATASRPEDKSAGVVSVSLRQRQTQTASPAPKPAHDAEPERAAPARQTTSPHAEAPAEPQETVQGAMGLVKEFARRYSEDECATRAAALAFFGVLSLVPILLFALAALGFFIRDPQQAATYVQNFIRQMLPGGQASNVANQVIAQTHIVESARTLINGRWWAAIIGVVSLLFSAISLFVTAADPMNRAWDVPEARGFIQLRLVALGVFAGAGLLFLLSLLPSAGPNLVRSLHIPWLGLPQRVPFWIDFLFFLVAVAIDLSMFVLIYRFLPNAPVTWKAALFGGVIAGILWEAFKKLFPVYLSHFGNYDKLYGTLGGLVLLVTWIYYSCMVLLAGAILCKMYHEHQEEGRVTRKSASPPVAALSE